MIEYELRGDGAWLRLNRPEKANAINFEMWQGLTEGITRAADEARAAVITGVDGVFTAGDDIEAASTFETIAETEEFARAVYSVYHTIETAEIPVIAAVNGLAHGGGCEIIAACDLAVAVDDAELGIPETRIGAYPIFTVNRVPVYGTRKSMMELILLAEPIDTSTAKDWGLVNRVVSNDDLESTVMEFVDLIAKSPKDAIRMAKGRANETIYSAEEREKFISDFVRLVHSETSKEAYQAFIEGRDPEFSDDE